MWHYLSLVGTKDLPHVLESSICFGIYHLEKFAFLVSNASSPLCYVGKLRNMWAGLLRVLLIRTSSTRGKCLSFPTMLLFPIRLSVLFPQPQSSCASVFWCLASRSTYLGSNVDYAKQRYGNNKSSALSHANTVSCFFCLFASAQQAWTQQPANVGGGAQWLRLMQYVWHLLKSTRMYLYWEQKYVDSALYWGESLVTCFSLFSPGLLETGWMIRNRLERTKSLTHQVGAPILVAAVDEQT